MKKYCMCILTVFFLLSGLFLPTFKQRVYAQEEALNVVSQYVAIYSVNEQSMIYDQKAHEQMYPASLTKIMTTLVALEHIDDLQKQTILGKEVFQGLEEEGASVAGYNLDEEAQLIDLLYGTMLPSGADAARAVAIYVAGSEQAFVDLMNQKAQELQLEHTHFMNTTGLHHKDHYSTAADMTRILAEALKNETFYQIFTANEYTSANGLRHFENNRQEVLTILEEDPKLITGSKTGYTLEGGLCLASLMNVDDADYLVITGNAGNDSSTMQHYVDAVTIHGFIHDNYETKTLYQANDKIRVLPIAYGKQEEVQSVLHDDITILVRKGEALEESVIMDTITAPINSGEEIAQFQIASPSIQVKHVYPLYAMQAVGRNWFSYTLHAWWFYVIVILFAILTLIFFIGKPRIVRTYRKFKRWRYRKKEKKLK